MRKNIKGTYQYLKRQKQIEILKTVGFFGLSLAVFLIGYLTTKTKGNLLTVVAILGCLPASKSAVNMIMFLKATGCSVQSHEEIERHIGGLTGLYDLYFTSYDKNFAISHLVVTSNLLLAYSESAKINATDYEAHMKKLLEQEGVRDYTVKLFTDQKKYIQRLDELNASDSVQAPSERVISMLKAVSL